MRPFQAAFTAHRIPRLCGSGLFLLLGFLPETARAVEPGTSMESPSAPAPSGPSPAEGGSVEAPSGPGPRGDAAGDIEATIRASDASLPQGDTWEKRTQNLSESNTISGGVGLLRLVHAQGGSPGQLRLGFMTQFYSGGFLCSASYECLDPNGGPKITRDSLNHVGGTLSLSASLGELEGFHFEGYASTMALATSSGANRPSLLQVFGDSSIGFKSYGSPWKSNYFGLMGEVMLVNGVGTVGLDGPSTSFRWAALYTHDMREYASPRPLRMTANVGYTFDNRGAVVEPTEVLRGRNGAPQPISRIERFGLNINRVDHLDLALGAEALLAEERLRPFFEYGLLVPANRQRYYCRSQNPSNDECLANQRLVPSRLTLGARFLPWRAGFSLLAAFDIGIAGSKTFIEETAPIAPWTFFVGAGLGIDTRERPPVVVSPPVAHVEEPGRPEAAPVEGVVTDQATTHPLAGVLVTVEEHPEVPPVATNQEGLFRSYDLPTGTYMFLLRLDGYKARTCEGRVGPGAAGTRISCPMESQVKVGNVIGTARDAETKEVLSGVTIRAVDGAGKELSTTTDPAGAFRFAGLTQGFQRVSADSPAHLISRSSVDVRPSEDATVSLLLRRKPAQAVYSVTNREISLIRQPAFVSDSAVLLPEGAAVLAEVVDYLERTPSIKGVEVQVHSDSEGDPARLLALTEERAKAIRQWLVTNGVAAERLSAKGYGQERPLAPNITPSMRAKNRRVVFLVTDGAP